MQKLQLQMPLHLGHCQSSNKATSSAFSPYLKHHKATCIEQKLACKNLLELFDKVCYSRLTSQTNLFNRHLWQNLRVHSLFPFRVVHAAMKSIVFCRHFEDYKQTRTERRTISINKRTNIEKRSLSASILLPQTI
jgi:hypothetical protein